MVLGCDDMRTPERLRQDSGLTASQLQKGTLQRDGGEYILLISRNQGPTNVSNLQSTE